MPDRHRIDPAPGFRPEAISPTASRRVVLKTGAFAAGLGAVGLGAAATLAQDATEAPTTAGSTPVTCVLTPDLTEGPYYLEGDLIRQEITEGRPGVPLRLRIAVSDPASCAPLANAAVDIWHCDAQGYYSGVASNNPGGDVDAETAAEVAAQTFLRGIQITDAAGIAEFETIYPGWYTGRTVHIHLKVAVEGTAGTAYEGGHVAHTGQLFFDDAISQQVYATEAYAGRDDAQRTTNDADNILGEHDDEPGFLLELTPLDPDSIAAGFLGEIAIGVDPSATPAAEGMDGNGGPPGDGGPGSPPPGA